MRKNPAGKEKWKQQFVTQTDIQLLLRSSAAIDGEAVFFLSLNYLWFSQKPFMECHCQRENSSFMLHSWEWTIETGSEMGMRCFAKTRMLAVLNPCAAAPPAQFEQVMH